jgi:hypothetical protein
MIALENKISPTRAKFQNNPEIQEQLLTVLKVIPKIQFQQCLQQW